jgi:hypothetical protein
MNHKEPTLFEVFGWAALILALPVGLMAAGYLLMEIYS